MRRIFLATIALVGATAILSACGSGPPELGQQYVVERVPDDRPRWITRAPSDRDSKLFFIGFKTHASSLENGNTDARQNGIQKIVEYQIPAR